MKKRAVILYLISFILILSSLLFINYAAMRAKAFAPVDTVVVLPVRHDSSFLFEPGRLTDRANAYNGLILTEHISTRMAEGNAVAGFAQVSFVEWDYFRIMHLPLIHGGFPQQDDTQAVVLCRNMAFALFGASDVVNFMVKISGAEYRITGVVESMTGGADMIDGFVWIGLDEVGAAGVLYLAPDSYNPLSARLDAEELLAYLYHRTDDYTITDGNAYTGSITLRGQLLLALCFPIFLCTVVFWLVRLFRLAESKAAYIVAAGFSALTLVITIFFIIYLSAIDLWLPAYAGEGLSGYSRLIFNTGLLAPAVYLPPPLAALSELSFNANIAFCAGLFGMFLAGITRFLTPQIKPGKV